MKMTKERFEEIEDIVQVFNPRYLHSLLILFELLEAKKIEVREVRYFVQAKRELEKEIEKKGLAFRKAEMEKWNKDARKCPICMRPLALKKITIPKGKGNINGYTCLWYCQEESCVFEEYITENFQEVYKKIMGG